MSKIRNEEPMLSANVLSAWLLLETQKKRRKGNKADTKRLPSIVLDLDETLIHSSIDPPPSSSSSSSSSTTTIFDSESSLTLYDEDQSHYYFVFFRPFVQLFIHSLAHHFQISIFTASYSIYGNPIIDNIDKQGLVGKRFFNTSLSPSVLHGDQKDLSTVSAQDVPKRILLIDNQPTVSMRHSENLYLIPSFRANDVAPADFELLALIPFLIALSQTPDFRSVLHRRIRFLK